MEITELEDGASEEYCDSGSQEIVPLKAKRALVGAGARVLFYPTLMYNVLRNRMQAEFRWWDEVEQVIVSCSSSTLFLKKKNPSFCHFYVITLFSSSSV